MVGILIVAPLDQPCACFQVQMTAVSDGCFESGKSRRSHMRKFFRKCPRRNDANVVVQLFVGKQSVSLQHVSEYLGIRSDCDHVGICQRELVADLSCRKILQIEVESRERVNQSPVAWIQNTIWSHLEIVPGQSL